MKKNNLILFFALAFSIFACGTNPPHNPTGHFESMASLIKTLEGSYEEVDTLIIPNFTSFKNKDLKNQVAMLEDENEGSVYTTEKKTYKIKCWLDPEIRHGFFNFEIVGAISPEEQELSSFTFIDTTLTDEILFIKKSSSDSSQRPSQIMINYQKTPPPNFARTAEARKKYENDIIAKVRAGWLKYPQHLRVTIYYPKQDKMWLFDIPDKGYSGVDYAPSGGVNTGN